VSGTICVIAQDTSRYSMFWVCLHQLEHPPKTSIDFGLFTDIPSARNTLVKRALENEAEWVLFVDDDQVFAPGMLTNLLAHEKPIVGALYLQRAGAHHPIAFSHRYENGLYEQINLRELPGEGLLKVQAVGTGGILIRTEVFRAISDQPDWFEHGTSENGWYASEDIVFCEKAQQSGYEIYVDLGTPIGHMLPAAVWPSFIDKEWCLGFSVSDSTRLYAPIEENAEAGAPADAVRR
jgi:hypothetical protein